MAEKNIAIYSQFDLNLSPDWILHIMPDHTQSRLAPELFHIDKSDGRPLQMQLTSSIIATLLDTRAAPGSKMPSTRKLASILEISRTTVTLVYDTLAEQGYLESQDRSGFIVSQDIPHRRMDPHVPNQGAKPVNWSTYFNTDLRKRRKIEKPKNWRDMKYPFIYGQTDPSIFNHNAWRDCARRALGVRDFSELANDQLSQDDPMLVDYIRKNTLPRRGIRASEDEVLITLGAQNALWITINLLAQNPIKVAIEDPGFPDFSAVLRQLNIPINFMASDGDGLLPDSIDADCDVVFTTPSHSIPASVTMSRTRREALLERAQDKNFLIIEDDYEYEMSFLEKPSQSLKSLDASGRVIYIGSFSKSLFPGLRIGYIVAPREFIAQARSLRAMMMRHPPVHMQRVTGYFLALGHYDAHLVRLRTALKARRETLVDALNDTDFYIAGAARHGGSSLWLNNRFGIDSQQLSEALTQKSVYVEPGHAFFETPQATCSFMRLGYSSIATNRIQQGIKLMQQGLMELKASGSAQI